jgi:hypothetical protein
LSAIDQYESIGIIVNRLLIRFFIRGFRRRLTLNTWKKDNGAGFMNYVKELRELVGTRPLILPGAVVIILNKQNEVLLQHRSDSGWGLPGGLMELGESLEETARREVKEETGLTVGELELMGIFSGNNYFIKL